MPAQSPQYLTWHVLGTGAIGCLYAAYLRRAGCDVRLLLRDAPTLEQLQHRGGIELQLAHEKLSIAVPAEIASSSHEQIRQVLICTKAQQTLGAIRSIKMQLAPRPVLVLLQNGMGVREPLQQEIPDAVILHAISTEGAYQTQRFCVVHAGHGSTVLGAINRAEQPIAQNVAAALRCELQIDAVDDIAQRLWLKLAVNCVINPLTALHRCRNGELLQVPNIDSIIDALCREFVTVANAENQALTLEQCRAAIHAVIRDTAMNYSSMLQDRLAHRPTEIDFINGFIVQRAQQHALACPHHTELLAAIKAFDP